MISRNLYARLEQVEARALTAGGSGGFRMAFLNSGSLLPECVMGPDSSYVWWKPPPGSKVGELVEDRDRPAVRGLRSEVMVIAFADGDGGEGPTTAMGPDGRLVWLRPPEGCKEGDPIEDSCDSDLDGEPGENYPDDLEWWS